MKTIKTRLDKFVFYYLKGDRTIGGRISLRKFERFETYLLKHLSREEGEAIDVGANIGYYSLILSRLYKRVVSFEPEATALKILKKNIIANNIKNIQVIGKAVSNKAEKLTLGLSKDNLGDHQINSRETERETVSVRSATLDQAIQFKVSTIKIDTQGWEPKVISGAKKIIRRDHPTLFLEYWPEGYKRSSLKYHEMINFLTKEYGRVYLVDDYLGLVYSVSPSTLDSRCLTKKGYVDLLFKKNLTFGDRLLFLKKFKVKTFIKNLLSLKTIH